MMPTPRIASAADQLPQTLADGVRAFAQEYPQCLEPKYAPLYLVALTAAVAVDKSPSAALLREYGLANSRLRKEILGGTSDVPSLQDLLGDDE